ncbi:uncharacterized protein LOC118738984 [Rhagoletis pomonella]|uniref:uncharacterized protein LOC118738984 n=1 Tax=Rhagoletis pomonella TaxID=28610 RepID=UPI00177CF70C|nr:uncharacterized protein LOC118738984 [Rhagoletis pomonella]
MKPIVVLTSSGEEKPQNIIKGILNTIGNPTENTESITIGSSTYLTYLCDLKTKYYENTIALLPYEGNICELPEDVLKATEMLMFYFDPDNKSFKQKLPDLCKLVTNNDIELGLLLTSKLFDDAKQGLTYESVKECYKFQFDVIELSNDEAAEEAGGYEEIVEALKNNIWSNVKVPGGNIDGQEGDMEEQLESFENLLSSIQNFKRISNGMERDQMLDEAEKLAELFIKMMNED